MGVRRYGGSWVIAGVMLVIVAYVLPVAVSLGGMSAYVVPAALYTLAAPLLYVGARGFGGVRREAVLPLLPVLIVMRIVTDVIAGAYQGFGVNLLSVSSLNVVINLIRLAPLIVSLELLRVTLVARSIHSSRVGLRILGVFAMMTVLYTSPALLTTLVSIGNAGSAIALLTSNVFPTAMYNIVLTVLALSGGATAAIPYAYVVKAYVYATPYLPVLKGLLRPVLYAAVTILQLSIIATVTGKSSVREELRSRLSMLRRRMKFRRVFNGVSIGVGLVAFAIIFTLIISGARLFVVVSGSMIPTLNIGDVAVVTPTKTVNVGTIAVYAGPSAPVIHRVIRVINEPNGSRLYVFKGDNNAAPDPGLVKESQIIGRYAFKIPYAGLPVLYLSRITGGYKAAVKVVLTLALFLYALVLFKEVISIDKFRQ